MPIHAKATKPELLLAAQDFTTSFDDFVEIARHKNADPEVLEAVFTEGFASDVLDAAIITRDINDFLLPTHPIFLNTLMKIAQRSTHAGNLEIIANQPTNNVIRGAILTHTEANEETVLKCAQDNRTAADATGATCELIANHKNANQQALAEVIHCPAVNKEALHQIVQRNRNNDLELANHPRTEDVDIEFIVRNTNDPAVLLAVARRHAVSDAILNLIAEHNNADNATDTVFLNKVRVASKDALLKIAGRANPANMELVADHPNSDNDTDAAVLAQKNLTENTLRLIARHDHVPNLETIACHANRNDATDAEVLNQNANVTALREIATHNDARNLADIATHLNRDHDTDAAVLAQSNTNEATLIRIAGRHNEANLVLIAGHGNHNINTDAAVLAQGNANEPTLLIIAGHNDAANLGQIVTHQNHTDATDAAVARNPNTLLPALQVLEQRTQDQAILNLIKNNPNSDLGLQNAVDAKIQLQVQAQLLAAQQALLLQQQQAAALAAAQQAAAQQAQALLVQQQQAAAQAAAAARPSVQARQNIRKGK